VVVVVIEHSIKKECKKTTIDGIENFRKHNTNNKIICAWFHMKKILESINK